MTSADAGNLSVNRDVVGMLMVNQSSPSAMTVI